MSRLYVVIDPSDQNAIWACEDLDMAVKVADSWTAEVYEVGKRVWPDPDAEPADGVWPSGESDADMRHFMEQARRMK